MKFLLCSRFFSTIIIACTASQAFAQWERVGILGGYVGESHSVFMTDSVTAYFTGWGSDGVQDGLIARTTDYGYSWRTDDLQDSPYIFGVTFPTRTRGFIMGYDRACACAAMYQTTNAGDLWTEQLFSSTYSFYLAVFPTVDTGFVCGYGGTILKTVDGGTTWVPCSTGTVDVFYTMTFLDTQTGYAAAGYGTDYVNPTEIFKTTNSGETWSMVSDFQGQIVVRGMAQTRNGLFLVGSSQDYEIILRSTDGAMSWDTIWKGGLHALEAIHFDGDIGYVVGDGGVILHSVDAGAHWTDVTHSTEDFPLAVWNIGEHVFVVGTIGLTLMNILDGGTGISNRSSIPGTLSVQPNPVERGGRVSLQLPAGGPYDIRVEDLLGREVEHFASGSNNGLRFSTLTTGTFFYSVRSGTALVGRGRFVVR